MAPALPARNLPRSDPGRNGDGNPSFIRSLLCCAKDS